MVSRGKPPIASMGQELTSWNTSTISLNRTIDCQDWVPPSKLIPRRLRCWILGGALGVLLAYGLSGLPTIAQVRPDQLTQAQQLTQQGQQQLAQGQPQAAFTSWLQAETLYRQLGNQTGAIGSQLNQAKALQAMGFYQRAKTLLEQMVTHQVNQPSSSLKANLWLTLGNLLRLTGDYAASQRLLTQSLRMAEAVPSPPDIQAGHLHLGNTLLAQQQVLPALDQFQQAAAIAGPLQLPARLHQFKLLQRLDRQADAQTLLAKMTTQLASLPPSQQTTYGRIELAALLAPPAIAEPQPVLVMPQQRRQAADLLAIAAQQARALGDRQAESYALGRLGQLYEQAQQWPEAERLTTEALQLATWLKLPEVLYQWQWQMGRIRRSQGNPTAARTWYTEAVQSLQQIRTDLVTIGQEIQFSFRDQVEPVYRELVDLLLQPDASQADLKQARQVIESLQLAELTNFFREACLDTTARAIDQVDPTAAVLYPILLPDRLAIILSLPGQPLRYYATALPQATILQGIEQMQASLRPTSFTQERLAAAQQIYGWLVQPVAETLAQAQIKTLVFVLDEALRQLPMAALHDGHHYLIEHYQVAVAPSLQLLSPQRLKPAELHALVGGLSAGTAAATPLPGVEQEVNQITQQIAAQILLNQAFTAQSFKAQMQSIPFTIVHLATHGQFSSNAQNTYIQTWDGRLTVEELRTVLNQRELTEAAAIELLVLSACETATGDKRAALGMAGVAVRSGARSTLATLWRVNDASTSTFMAAFYKTLTQAGMTKAKAVQLAQLSLIHSPQYKHPFYWAPFILVGNWL